LEHGGNFFFSWSNDFGERRKDMSWMVLNGTFRTNRSLVLGAKGVDLQGGMNRTKERARRKGVLEIHLLQTDKGMVCSEF